MICPKLPCISISLLMGANAWSSRLLARPSQNNLSAYQIFNREGVFLLPSWWSCPCPTTRPSVQDKLGAWQEEQDICADPLRRGSKNNIFPNLIRCFSESRFAFTGLSGKRPISSHPFKLESILGLGHWEGGIRYNWRKLSANASLSSLTGGLF